MISANKIIGALVFRTREALNKNTDFMELAKTYYFSGDCIINDRLSLWHYPGTPSEISTILNTLTQAHNGSRLKFPSIFNFNTIQQTKVGNKVTIHYNLAIVGRVLNNWTTEERESNLFDPLLRGIYDEFINQVVKCGWFNGIIPTPSHTYYEVFTTGGNQGVLLKMYGDYIDAIELHNLSLDLKPNLCNKDKNVIEEQNSLVTQGFEQILKD